jgi:hypothetical protein
LITKKYPIDSKIIFWGLIKTIDRQIHEACLLFNITHQIIYLKLGEVDEIFFDRSIKNLLLPQLAASQLTPIFPNVKPNINL